MLLCLWRATALLSLTTNLAAAFQADIPPNNFEFPFIQRRQDKPDVQPKCPSCFNCNIKANKCFNSGICNTYTGKCECLPGFGGDDCTLPLCGGLSDGLERYTRPSNTKECACKDGWGGINCNMCETNDACNSLIPGGTNETCYKGGIVVNRNYQMCSVTNKNVVSKLKGRPEVTFSCNRTEAACDFQFWVSGDQSFGCSLSECEYEDLKHPPSSTEDFGAKCKKITCSCIPERYLCSSKSFSIAGMLETIQGPGLFRCNSKKNCIFSEPSLDEIIQSLAGDKTITLDCQGGECLHYTQVPGYHQPPRPIALTIAGIASLSMGGFTVALLVFYAIRKHRRGASYVPLDWDNESGKLMAHHCPATLSFRDIHYHVGGRDVLHGVLGVVEPGQIMAIMGASGAGKTSFLDILARRNKAGIVSGDICVNGRVLSNSDFKKLVGYVDQEDTLMPTLTVYETVLNSALLRLPSNMSLEAKRLRVVECLSELGILGIKDSRIGSSGKRGISGGEKRRVSIACELVTSPAILFLDEPTSGLDAFSAQAVVDCLVRLARNFRRTIVFTIHQPRSDIFSKFDRLVLMAKGWPVFTGPASEASSHFASLGHPCPPGYNTADFLIDLAQEPSSSIDRTSNRTSEATLEDKRSFTLEENGLGPYLNSLVQGFKKSPVFAQLSQDISLLYESAQASAEVPKKDFEKPTWLVQFNILSRRTFLNLYRDPILMLCNYGISLFIGGLCGTVYYQVENNIMGLQNRVGLFFFICSLFAFSCLTSLQTFHPERILFMRERANGYYHPSVYFAAKVLFDLVPLRVVPPFLLGMVVYPLVGLNPGFDHFMIFHYFACFV
ncbi:FAD-dependent urate hydroxylase [Entomophthora muscae]|uniref:FAD-dependent urate hydroxylase n=1 Tax=Entomophthora muscae TaxID=34485 RepID=A0ACC2TYA7_9FUNG|nr:FAD-dependent urate hydroxylase [Entomophthora muscae]